ncbi:NAD(P)H-dependent oxidoreductase [Mucilaginibacter sabulilitoris]|uniref:FMN dependent NADH:quinone oxidoreductase n=1 Tax=Mucilaginibacter sabulilitoris TaxID=1173583 RepID=A0ABZ0TKC2_9SPHI|nr:NAD(P)H-dependent oxidoreductase [Mucilaginibacter sabulilitoris]WPU93615.1 NAD(P)H-dependent oxidoreductase [Mucilaginibacter sabulilitoris]
MKKVLIINASARTLESKSRELTKVFVNQWNTIYEKPEIKYRELGNAPIAHISEAWIAATLKPVSDRSESENKVLAESNTYIAELKEANVIVLGSPMYNWSIPSALKAYIDQVFRVNETFRVNLSNPENPYVGLLENKTLFLLLSRGGQHYEKGEANAHLNFQSTYLKTVFDIMGIRNIYMIAIDGASLDKEKLKYSIEIAHQKVRNLIGAGIELI